MNQHKYTKMPTSDAEERYSKYDPILKFSYTNPHKIIKPVSNKAVTRWSAEENRSYVEKNVTASKYATKSTPKSPPTYENLPNLNDDDCTYESIDCTYEYVNGVYRLKAAEPLVMPSRTPHRAVTKNTFSQSVHNQQILFSEMTYEERQEERRRLELGEEKGFPVYDYFAKSEALRKNAPSPAETHTRNNYSKWLLNEMNKERNLGKLSEVRQKVAVASAFREPYARATTPTPPAVAAQHKQYKTAHHVQYGKQEHIRTTKSSAGGYNTNGCPVYVKGDDTGEIMAESDSRSDSPFEFTSRRARFENADSAKSEEIRSYSTKPELTITSVPSHSNAVQAEYSRVSPKPRKWEYSPSSRQDEVLSPRQDRQGASSPFVQDSSNYRYTSTDDCKANKSYRIDERQGYIEKIDENAEGNIYDYPQVPPRPVEVRFSFQSGNESKLVKAYETSPLQTSQQNNQIPTKDIQFADVQGEHRSRTNMRGSSGSANLSGDRSPSAPKSEVSGYSSTRSEHSSSRRQSASPRSKSLTQETAKSKLNSTTHEASYQTGSAGWWRAKSHNLKSEEHTYGSPKYSEGKARSSQFSSTSQNVHIANASKANDYAELSTKGVNAFDSTSGTLTSSRRSRKDLFQETYQEREEKLETKKIDDSTPVRRSQSFDRNCGKAEKSRTHDRKVSDMIKLFEELAQQKASDGKYTLFGQYHEYGYDRTKTGSLNDVRISTTAHNASLYQKELATTASRSASCTQLYTSQAVEHHRGEPKYSRDTIIGSSASLSKASGEVASTETTIEKGTYKLFDARKVSSNVSPRSKVEQTTKGVDSASTWTSKSSVSKQSTSDIAYSEKKSGTGVRKTVGFRDDPPFFSTKTYSSSQSQRQAQLPEKEKSEQVQKLDSYESTDFNIKNVPSLHYSHDPQISAFEKYEPWRTNLKANDKSLREERFSQEKSRMASTLRNETHRPLDYHSSNTSVAYKGIHEATASRNRPAEDGENYYVTSTVTVTRRHPQRSPIELSGSSTFCNTFEEKCTAGTEKIESQTRSENLSLANASSNLSSTRLPAHRSQQSARSPIPTRPGATRLYSPVNESIFDQGISRSSSTKFISETDRHLESSNQTALNHAKEQSFRASRASSNQRIRPRSQSADPEHSMRKSSSAYGLKTFRVMSPGPALHFARMTEEARQRAEGYHVNSDQMLLNIFFDRLIEQHKYSSTSDLQAKREIVEQSRFVRDSPGFLKQTASGSNNSQGRQLTSQSTQGTSTKQAEILESSSSRRAAHSEVTRENTGRSLGTALQKVDTVSGSPNLNMPLTHKIYSGHESSSDKTIESLTQSRITNSSRFQSGLTYSDEKDTFRLEKSANHQNLAHHYAPHTETAERPDESKFIRAFQVQTRANELTKSTSGPSPSPLFGNKESGRYCQAAEDKNFGNAKKQTQPEIRSYPISQFSASNRDFSYSSTLSGPRAYSDNVQTNPSQRTSESYCTPAPEYFQASSSEYNTQEQMCSRDTSELRSSGTLSYSQNSSNTQTERKIPKEYFHNQEFSSSFQKSSRSSSHGQDRLASPLAYNRTSRSEIAYSSPQNFPSRTLSPASSLFTDDRNWTPRVLSPNQFSSVSNVQTLERSAASPVGHNDNQKDSNVLRFMVNNYDGMSDIEARKQMYFRSLDADCATLKGRMQSPLPQSSVHQTERA